MFKRKNVKQAMVVVVLSFVAFLSNPRQIWAATVKSVAMVASGGSSSSAEGGSTALPDLFTGTMSYQIPIEVPPGRNGMEPGIALKYRSGNGNGWLGVGWELELGSIQHSLKDGVKYDDDNFQFKTNSSVSDLVNVGSNEYLATIESRFSRIRKLTGSEGLYWEVTEKNGMRFLFGQKPGTRQDNPGDATQIFKWCLDRIEDPNGNYISITYFKDIPNGQIYPEQISYTGNSSNNVGSTNYVKFTSETRSDVPDNYLLGFRVRTAYRLQRIETYSNGSRVKLYNTVFAVSPSISTKRSLLLSVETYGNNVTLDANGKVTSGTALPAISFVYDQGEATLTNGYTSGGQGVADGLSTFADINGGGKAEYIAVRGDGHHFVTIYNDDGTVARNLESPGGQGRADGPTAFADINGDGKADYITVRSDGWHFVTLYNDDGSIARSLESSGGNGVADGLSTFADINGDGKAEYITVRGDGCNFVTVYNDNGTVGQNINSCGGQGRANGPTAFADINGDGKAEYITVRSDGWHFVTFYNNDGTVARKTESGGGQGIADGLSTFADINGDGKAEYITVRGDGHHFITFYNNDGTVARSMEAPGGHGRADGPTMFADINGDGKAEYITIRSNGTHYITFYNDDGTIAQNITLNGGHGIADGPSTVQDINGDGRAEYSTIRSNGEHYRTFYNLKSDLLVGISNGLGGTTSISYTPSTHYTNTQLPFPVQTVSSIATNDGNGNVSTTDYTFSGGYYHTAERDFRGFSYAKVTGQADTNGVRTIAETWFHQGNDTAVDVNNPNVPTGYMKGKPYRTRVTDTSGNKYSETTTSYSPDATSPYFNPPLQVDNYVYDGDSSPKQTQAVYAYDDYGNVKRDEYHGEVSADDRTTVRTFSPNTANWIVGLPATEDVYQGRGTAAADKIAGKVYYYDDLSDCNGSPTGNQTPLYGKLTRVESYLAGWTNPEIRMAYNSFGNLVCKRDAKGNTTTIAYDASNTFPTSVTNPLGQQSVTTYYGVNDVAADKGLYGQVKSSSDPNGATTTIEYDTFGRKKLETYPDGTWTSVAYNSFGSVGSQHVRTVNSAGLWKENYFDGLGRTFKVRSSGPDNKTIVSLTVYNSTGTVEKTSLPYFDGLEAPRYQTFTYDTTGRVLTATNTDTTVSKACYKGGVTVKIDANKHRRREVRSALGRLVKVQEYLGVFSACSTDEATPYATTTYQYDVPGNLRFLTDAKGNQTEMRYDTLGRKRYMHDPDMGVWGYTYDANGNLETQTDALGQVITFGYDNLNRLQTKKHGAALVLTNTYDEVVSGYFNKGHLTRMVDTSGQAISNYDKMGRVVNSAKTISGVTYPPLSFSYVQGRLNSITYPDNVTVTYGYNGGDLSSVGGYADYTGYNALGQPGVITFGNGVATTYKYVPENNRVRLLSTAKLGGPTLSLLVYDYDNVGNITGISNVFNSSRSQSFSYDEQNRLTQAINSVYGTRSYSYDEIGNIRTKEGISYDYTSSRPHAVTSINSVLAYTYDPNGNLISDALRGTTYTYNYDNMPTSTGNVSFTYDGTGTRVKKSTPTSSTVYINKLYECSNGVCTKYIFAGDTRIARNTNGVVNYFHPDHLGGTNLVTNAIGAVVEDIAYYPFGSTRLDSNTALDSHKFTGQEKDAETGLYNYNARLYDADLGRFMTPDSIVPDPGNPQSLNRYSYVLNNPINSIDPSGHFSLTRWMFDKSSDMMGNPGKTMTDLNHAVKGIMTAEILLGTAASGQWWAFAGAVSGGAVGGYSASKAGGDIWNGILSGTVKGGAISGAFTGVGYLTNGMNPFIQIGAKGLTGGLVSSAMGGKFSTGFLVAASAATLYWGYTQMAGFEPTLAPGEDIPGGRYEPNDLNQAPQGKNVFGLNELKSNNFYEDFWRQGGAVSSVANYVPGMNAVAGLHDYWMNNISMNIFTNVGTMVPAAAMNYGAQLGGQLSPLTVQMSGGRSWR